MKTIFQLKQALREQKAQALAAWQGANDLDRLAVEIGWLEGRLLDLMYELELHEELERQRVEQA